MMFHEEITRLSREFGSSGQLQRVRRQEHSVGLEEKENLAGKVDLASERTYQDFHRGGS